MSAQYTETVMMIPGPAGALQSILTADQPVESLPQIALICHPHPLHGGTMNNKVITTVTRSFRDAGIASIRFNYRGVGESDGAFGDAIGETEDLLAVYAWLRQQNPDADVFLAGFSFGSYVVYRASADIQPAKLITIAPAVHHHQYDELPVPQCPWLLVMGDADEVVPADQVYAWADGLSTQPTLIKFPETSHFFHGKLIELRQQLTEFIA